MNKQADDQYTEVETIERREAALRRMLATPPKSHKAMAGKSKDSPTKPRSRAKTKAA